MKVKGWKVRLDTGRIAAASLRLFAALVLVFLGFVGTGKAVAVSGWYDTDWLYRKMITIDHTRVPDNLTDYPMMFKTIDIDLKNKAQNDGDDILFTAADGTTKLDHEIEQFDGVTGIFVAWVRIPALSSSADTNIYMYYGNPGAANQQNVTGVWNSNYVAVWHLSEDPSGTAPQMLDSTSNDHNGTTQGSWDSSNQVTGLIDGTLDFNSGQDKVEVGTFDIVGAGTGNDGLTLETWFFSHDDVDGRFISKAYGTDTQQHYWMLNALVDCPYRLRFRLKTDWYTTLLLADEGHSVPLYQWVYAAATYDGSYMRIYQDATQVASTPKTGTIAANPWVNVAIGNQPQGAGDRRFDGHITELRISNIARSQDWIQTCHNNIGSPQNFYTIGMEECCITLPTVTTADATLVEENTATFHGNITDDGGEACQYRFVYGTVSGGPYPYNTGWTGSKTTGESFSEDITGLYEGTKYYFRAQAKNSSGTSEGDELNFLTKPNPPINGTFTATAVSDNQVSLTWTKGEGAWKTLIRRDTGGYPADRNSGTQVYFDIGTTHLDSGLTPGTTYYYRSWSYVTGSEQWSDGYRDASATTTGEPEMPPVAVGGTVFEVNKSQVLAPWLVLFAVVVLTTGGVLVKLRRRV